MAPIRISGGRFLQVHSVLVHGERFQMSQIGNPLAPDS
jgi:hypothetical protein